MKNNYFIGLGGSGGKIITQLYNRLMSECGEYATGSFDVSRDPVWVGGCIIAAIILIIILYLIACWMTVIRFNPGKFYVAEFNNVGANKWELYTCASSNAFRLFVPAVRLREKQRKVLRVGEQFVEVYPKNNPMGWSLFEANYPVFNGEAASKNGVYTTQNISEYIAERIIKGDDKKYYVFKSSRADSTSTEVDINESNALYYQNENKLTIAFYVPKGK